MASYAVQYVMQMFNKAWSQASMSNSYINSIPNITGSIGWTSTSAGDVAIPIEPDVEIPRVAEGAELAKFHLLSDAIIDKLVDVFRNYLTEFLPNECPYLERAQRWICRTLSGQNPTGLEAFIEQQIWDRERDRILAENERAKATAYSDFASRGYPMPPGALNEAILVLERENMRQIGESSRTIAIEMAKIELENMRFAVEQAIALYTGATSAAGEYIKALALGPQIGMEVIPSVTDSQSKLIEAANSYYQSRIAIAEMIQKNAQFNAEMNNKASQSTAELSLDRAKANQQAMVDKAKVYATMAAAALNAVSANASMSSVVNASNSVSYSYSNDTKDAAPTRTLI
jgi:hypothetical protein